MKIIKHDDTTIEIPIDDNLKIYNINSVKSYNDQISISFSNGKYEIRLIDTYRIVYEKVTPAAVDDITSVENNTWTIAGDDLILNIASDNCPLYIYSINGIVVLNRKLHSGHHVISLETLPRGVYIMNLNTSQTKFVKK